MKVLRMCGAVLLGLAAAWLLLGMSKPKEASSAADQNEIARNQLRTAISAEYAYYAAHGMYGTREQLKAGRNPYLDPAFPRSNRAGVLFGFALSNDGQNFAAFTICQETGAVFTTNAAGTITVASLDQLAQLLLAANAAPVQ